MKLIKKIVASSLMAMMFIGVSLTKVEAAEEIKLELGSIISEIEANDMLSQESENLKNRNLELMGRLEKENQLHVIRIAYLDEEVKISNLKLEKLDALKPGNFIEAAILSLSGGYEKLTLSDQLTAIYSDLKSFERLEVGVLKVEDLVLISKGLKEKISELEEEKTVLNQIIIDNETNGIALDNEIVDLTEKISEVASAVETLSARKVELEEVVRIEEEHQRQLELESKRENTFTLPTSGRLTSPFGKRIHPVTGKSSFHTGIDLANSSGTSIVASRNGKVIFAGRKGTYGNLIVIRHSNGMETAYAHLSAIQVSVGQNVTQGQQIGKMGTTGRSTGSHLHFEIRVNGTGVNPYSYLN